MMSSGFPRRRSPAPAVRPWRRMSTGYGQRASAPASTSPCWAIRTVRRPWPTLSAWATCTLTMRSSSAAPEPTSPPAPRAFTLTAGTCYVGDASTDPVGMLGQLNGLSKTVFGDNIGGQVLGTLLGLGADPALDGFGSVRFRAEVPGSDGISPHDHSYYYHLGSESLHSMADITSRHGDALAADGMTAEHRYQPGKVTIPGLGEVGIVLPDLPVVVDPEWSRAPGSITDDHVFDEQHHH